MQPIARVRAPGVWGLWYGREIELLRQELTALPAPVATTAVSPPPPPVVVHDQVPVSRAFPSWSRCVWTEIRLCHACSYPETGSILTEIYR
jgi:hypothetical protein